MMRRTWIVDAAVTGAPGQILVMLYDEGITGMVLAYRERVGDSWGPPMIAKETT